MRQHSNWYIIGFAGAVCIVCSIFVAGAAVGLKDRQEANKALDRQKKVLAVSGLLGADESLTADEVRKRYDANIRPRVIDLVTGQYAEGIDAASFDQRKAAKDPATRARAKENAAKVMWLPKQAVVYQVMDGEKVSRYIFPVEGKGLWSTLYGFLALEADLNTVAGITFYEHGETPGLGGEVDNPSWKALWLARKVFDDDGKPQLEVIKGRAPGAEAAPYKVDGISGATLTCRGVTALVRFWMGEQGFGPYLANEREGR